MAENEEAPTSTATYTSSLDEERGIIGKEIGRLMTMGEALAASEQGNPTRIQYVTPSGEEVSATGFATLCRQAAQALISLNVERRDGVAIIGANSLEWFIADVGATLAGAIPTGIYVTNHEDVVTHILKNARVTVAFAASHNDLVKLIAVKAQCPLLRTIVYWGDAGDIDSLPDHREYLLSWEEFMQLDDGNSFSEELGSRVAGQRVNDCCKLIYTSGTTGLPKAVMISHANIGAAVQMVGQAVQVTGDDVLVSYLPCSHIAANMMDIMGPIMLDFKVHIAPPDALKGSLVSTLKKARPTIFLAVPRVWEKMREKMIAIGGARSYLSRYVSSVAKAIGSAATDAEDAGRPLPYGTTLCDYAVFSTIRAALGLDRARLMLNSTAPMLTVTDDYFRSLRMRIFDLYGASEAAGPLTSNLPHAYKRGSSGRPLPGVELRVLSETGEEGELCFRGRNMFMGYLDNAAESRKALDEDGFYHSGDLGTVDCEGYVTITGRIKELIITAGGENVAPLLLEGAILNALPGIARAFAVGDKRKFVSCLLIPYIDEEGKLCGLSKSVNTQVSSAEDAKSDSAWAAYIDSGIRTANVSAVSNAAKVKKWALLTRDFSVERNELTPSLKVKRKIVLRNFADEIEAIYS